MVARMVLRIKQFLVVSVEVWLRQEEPPADRMILVAASLVEAMQPLRSLVTFLAERVELVDCGTREKLRAMEKA